VHDELKYHQDRLALGSWILALTSSHPHQLSVCPGFGWGFLICRCAASARPRCGGEDHPGRATCELE
jgi:hypothetical protein